MVHDGASNFQRQGFGLGRVLSYLYLIYFA